MSAVEVIKTPLTIESDGLIIDVQTGEVLGMVESIPSETLTEDEVKLIRSRLTRRALRAHLANNALTAAEVAMKAIEDEAVFQARQSEEWRFQEKIAQNSRQIADKAQREHDGLLDRFREGIKAFLRKHLTGKSRTWESEFGKFGLRAKAARLAVVDEEKFVKKAIETGRTEWLKLDPRISAVPKDLAPEMLEAYGVQWVPATDELTESA